jgi:3D (Asp-Asp-Asp) domain-containing protein
MDLRRIMILFIIIMACTFFLLFYANQQAKASIKIINDNQKTFEKKSKKLDFKLRKLKEVKLTVTAYSPRNNETDDTPLVTAFQKPVKYGIIGISRDLEKLYGWKEGDDILLEGIGIFEVGDRMHRRWEKRVDVFYWDTKDAANFGVIKTVGYKINYSEI